MSIDDVNSAIAELSELYSEINAKLEHDPCKANSAQVELQKRYRDFYEQLKKFNTGSLLVNTAMYYPQGGNAIERLRGLIDENVALGSERRLTSSKVYYSGIYLSELEYRFGDKIKSAKEEIEYYLKSKEDWRSETDKWSNIRHYEEEIDRLEEEKKVWKRENEVWIMHNYYSEFYEISKKIQKTINELFHEKKKEDVIPNPKTEKRAVGKNITRNKFPKGGKQIFKQDKEEQFLILEELLISDGFLTLENEKKKRYRWTLPSGKKGYRGDGKRYLVAFIIKLLDDDYIDPLVKDIEIKNHFSLRYHVDLGENFQKARRENMPDYFYEPFNDYPF